MRPNVHVNTYQSDLFAFQDGTTAAFQDGTDWQINGEVWVDVSADIASRRVTHTRGLKDASATRRIASKGSCQFVLDNGETNAAGLQGYFSPDHANAMLGWEEDNKTRLGYQDDSYSSDVVWRWHGWLSSITPAPGKFRSNDVDVSGEDYISMLMDREGAKLLDLLTDTTEDVAYQAIVDAQPVQPEGTNFSTGIDTLDFVFHRTGEKSGTGFEEMRRVAQSVMGYVYVDKDGQLASQNRLDRTYNATPSFTISDTDDYMVQVSYTRNRKRGVDKITSVTYPVAQGADTETVFELENPIRLNPGESYTLVAEFRDPNSNKAVGMNNPVSLIAGTHYKFGSVDNGTHNNLIDNLTVTESFYGGAAEVVFTNDGEQMGFVNALVLEGNILRTDDPVQTSLVVDAAGNREIKLDLPYQSSEAFARSARYMTKYHYEGTKHVSSVTFNVNDSDMYANFITSEIGDRIAVTETVTGLATHEAYINAITVNYKPDYIMDVTYHLATASTDTVARWDVSTWGSGHLWAFGEG